MSEEEIIKEVESAIWFMKEDNYNVNTFVKAIQGLLDLYNKEKEKNKILELTKIPYLEGEIMAYKENDAVQRKMLNDAFDRGWIHKDKIKEIIYPTPTNPISYEIQTSDMYKKILELLGEE